MKRNYYYIPITFLLYAIIGCKSSHLTESQRFERSIMKELPFAVDSVRWLTGVDLPTFRFSNVDDTPTAPDAEIRPDESWEVWNYVSSIYESLASIWITKMPKC